MSRTVSAETVEKVGSQLAEEFQGLTVQLQKNNEQMEDNRKANMALSKRVHSLNWVLTIATVVTAVGTGVQACVGLQNLRSGNVIGSEPLKIDQARPEGDLQGGGVALTSRSGN